jgi:hypothetical protein
MTWQAGRRRLAAMTAVAAMTIIAGAAALAGAGPAAAATAGANTSTVAHSGWGDEQEVPGTATLNTGGSAQVDSVSCPSPGNCAAGGYYTGSSAYAAFVATQVDGTWGTAKEIPGLSSLTSQNVGNADISCPSVGNCTATGDYTGNTEANQVYVADEVNGTWANAEEVPGLASLNTGGNAYVEQISCPSAGNCVLGGSYEDSSGLRHAFVADEVNGTWGNAQEVPGITSLEAGGISYVYALSCASAGNCVAGGEYGGADQSSDYQAFVVDEVNGTWGNAQEVPGITSLNAGSDAGVFAVSCGSAGNCAAAGQYLDSDGNQVFLADEVNGTWGNAEQIPGTGSLNIGDYAQVNTLSCASAGNCAVGGQYADAVGPLPFVADEVNGTWGNAQEVPGMAALSATNAGVAALSCPSAGNCSAGGWYQDTSNAYGSFVTDEVNGTWGNAKQLPSTAALNSAGSGVNALSCAAPGNCAAGGWYQPSGSSTYQAMVATELRSSTALTLSKTRVAYGGETAVRAGVTVSPGTPSGTVTVNAVETSGGSKIKVCTITLTSGTGSCTLAATVLPAGKYHVTASYAGSATVPASTSGKVTLTITK